MIAAGRVVVVGDALLDRDIHGRAERLAPDAPVPVLADPSERPRPGGAALAAALVAADGVPTTLVTALGPDGAGARLRELLADCGVELVDLGGVDATAEKVRVRADGQWVARLDYGGPGGEIPPWTADADAALDAAHAVLVSDYGRGVCRASGLHSALRRRRPGLPVVWDPHVRGGAPPAGVTLVTPNERETAAFAGEATDAGLASLTARAQALRERWGVGGVVVTRGAAGALLVGGDGTPLAAPAPPLPAGDPCGAGDRFAASLVVRLAAGLLPSEALGGAVGAASAFVAAGGAGAWRSGAPARPAPAGTQTVDALLARVRAEGGTVVATGGCFDLLHAGHVQVLQAARALGDCLVVCLNSDASVRRLKGPSRPLVAAADRAAVLAGITGVDAVVVFEEDTPEAVLSRLRPDVWAKGADYAVADLPEARLVASWGGQAVVLPYLPGRSTSGLVHEAGLRVTLQKDAAHG